ncbi:hypothetical protein SAMN04487968_10663 [Nocardioides terrae]|uniref:Uncharacterized protein n=1 Tax=Nocardioides terrae TaxID=574651 RepID=A0A1I1ISY0_9ACTN|nr:hypothetical protein [Nocardioides terrae]SFC39344.1 hypothetical protein SAMN04487968_10663 [Nocardioides terrae]
MILLGSILVITQAEVAPVDVARFGAYLAGWIVLPGTLAWRWLGLRREARPLGEDLAIGALVGYVIEFPVYLGCLAAGHPRLYLLWPAIAIALSLAHPSRRLLWTRRGERMPLAWSWGISAGAAYVLTWFAHEVWAVSPVTTSGLRRPYIDEPFHLALATGLKEFFPPRITYVADEHLEYHWLSHLHVAAASWASGVEPIVLLRSLSLPTLTVFVCVALAFVAVRLSDARWTGLAVMAGLLVAPVNFSNWSDGSGERFLVVRIMASPSAGFVNAALVVGVLLALEMLRGKWRGPAVWLAMALSMIAMIGAKSTSLPTLMAGLVAATLIAVMVDRSRAITAAGLAVLSVVAFVVGMYLFFGGGGTHGLAWSPFTFTSEFGALSRGEAALAAVSSLGYLSTGAGALAWLARGGWRQPDRVFLVVLCASGLGAGLAFHQEGLSEYYFVYVVFLPMLLGGVLGLHAVWPAFSALIAVPPPTATGRITRWLPSPIGRLLVGALVVGLIAGLLLIAVDREAVPTATTVRDLDYVVETKVFPMTLVLLVVGGIALATTVAARARGLTNPTKLLMPALILAFVGTGLAPTTARALELATGRDSAVAPPQPAAIAAGGIVAARWLRAHAAPQDLVATNAHCAVPRAEPCDARQFWMAAYSERQFLVEGWAYVPREASGPDERQVSSVISPFWDHSLLTANDAAFQTPTQERLDALRERGVRWLLVDRAYPVDLDGLVSLTRKRFSAGRFTVLQLS